MINKNIVIDFIRKNFDKSEYIIGENEIQLNSPFKNDTKKHLGISLSSHNVGVWNDLKPPQESGNFFSFISKLKNISYKEAKMFLVKEYLNEININSAIQDEDLKDSKELYEYKKIQLPKYVLPVLKDGNLTSDYASGFLNFLHNKRNIDIKTIEKRNIMYGYDGDYFGYLIVPFYNEKNELVYYLARNLKTKKYKNVKNSIAQGKGGGIGYNIFTQEKTVVLTEGVWDALKIPKNGVALLSNRITIKQIEHLKKYKREKIIIAGDNYKIDKKYKEDIDKMIFPGRDGILYTARTLKEYFPEVKIYLFMWEEKFSQCKDFSRCNFKISIDDIEKRSNIFDENSEFKIKLFSRLNDI